MTRVFISYSHELTIPNHRRLVDKLVEELESPTIEIVYDAKMLKKEPGGPHETFTIWAEIEIKKADKILIVASPEFKDAWILENNKRNLGLKAEILILRRLVMEDEYRPEKIRAVVLQEENRGCVPDLLLGLRAFHTYKKEDLDALHEWLNLPGQSKVPFASAIDSLTKFFGHSELLQSLRNHQQGNSTVGAVALKGFGGSGKTELARQFGAQMKSRFSKVIEVDLQGYSKKKRPLQPVDFAIRVIQTCISSYQMQENALLSDVIECYHNTIHGKNLLLVADNFQPKKGCELDLQKLVPYNGSLLLFTSRDEINIDGITTLKVEKMTCSDAVGLLRLSCNDLDLQKKSDEAFCRLAELSGYSPMALRGNASILNDNKLLRLESLCSDLEQKPNLRLLHEKEAFQVSFNLLPRKLQTIWTKLSVFPSNFDSLAASSILGYSKDTVDKFCSQLESCSLLNCDREKEIVWFDDHLRLFAQQKLYSNKDIHREVEKQYIIYYTTWIRDIAHNYFAGSISLNETLPCLEANRVNWELALNRVVVSLTNCDPEHWGTLEKVALPLISVADMEFSQTCYKMLQTYCLSANDVLFSFHSEKKRLGIIRIALELAKNRGDYEAVPEVVIALGRALQYQGYVDKSEEFIQPSDYDDCRLECYRLLGLARVRITKDDQRGALKKLRQALQYSWNGPLPLCLCEVLLEIGSIYRKCGRPSRAQKLFKIAHSIARRFGNKRFESAALGSLGSALRKLGEEPFCAQKLNDAITLFKQQLVITGNIGFRSAEGIAHGNIGTAQRKLGDWNQAIQSYKKSLSIAREVKDRKSEGAALYNLAKTRWDLGHKKKAIALVVNSIVVKTPIKDSHLERAWESLRQWLSEV